MGRANLAIGLALVASAVLPAASDARRFHYSHRVSISGSLVDHWTINDTRSCGPVGDGTVTVEFHQKRPAKARVEYNRVEGRWEAFVPAGGLLGGLPSKPVVGTLGLVDNTVATPPPPGFDCADQPIDKSGCGTSSLGGKAGVDGVRRGFTADLSSSFRPKHGECSHGNVESWTQFPQAVGGVNGGLVRVKMPNPRSFKRRHTVTVTGTVHKTSSFGGSDPDQPKITDDVTRKVTITFTKL